MEWTLSYIIDESSDDAVGLNDEKRPLHFLSSMLTYGSRPSFNLVEYVLRRRKIDLCVKYTCSLPWRSN